MNKENNLAFVDGQNLYMGTRSNNLVWKVDLAKFREYLFKKYNVQKAYYYLGCVDEKYQDLYEEIQSADFIKLYKLVKFNQSGADRNN